MPYAQEVKELAYTLDPPAWVSYSGRPRNYKAVMDGRRSLSLIKAQQQIDAVIERRHGGRRVSQFRDEPLDSFMVEIIDGDGCQSVEYSDSLCLGDDIQRWINDGRVIGKITIYPN
ncbi:hypothetical protein QA639_21245 [Bradyrhizobium pachyrhizi]|uniref:hypothetical protein n=1 Tax=Bradyrhizobium pachyrhizi TaxID=280333 RepID=UPI0024B0F9EF|nr:hypothetical protein [Bradyrhizobium pachyrhizi]WFU52236.1 hypothetical protein QA639_21245 [Bradyrhizobium pachyrhizi]